MPNFWRRTTVDGSWRLNYSFTPRTGNSRTELGHRHYGGNLSLSLLLCVLSFNKQEFQTSSWLFQASAQETTSVQGTCSRRVNGLHNDLLALQPFGFLFLGRTLSPFKYRKWGMWRECRASVRTQIEEASALPWPLTNRSLSGLRDTRKLPLLQPYTLSAATLTGSPCFC